MQVFWFERWNFCSGRCRRRLAGLDIADRPDDDTRRVDLVDHAAAAATIAAPESRATVSSMPVPTSGASACTSGTA